MVPFSSVQESLGPRVESYLKAFLSEQAASIGPALSAMAHYHFQTGGKRLRSLIPSYIYENLGRKGIEILPFGVSVEMVHNATLVHDDIQDGDLVRRGQPTVWKKFSKEQAINLGDAMFQYAYLPLFELDLSPKILNQLMITIAHSTIKVIEGQAQEFIMKDERFPGLNRYLQVIQGKTSGLFALPVMGALEAAGISGELYGVAQSVAEDLGVLFQIQDDYLDLYGEKGRDRPASDIAEGKISFFAAYLYENAPQNIKVEFEQILKTPRSSTTDAQIHRALEMIEDVGARKAAITKVQSLKDSIESNTVLKSKLPGLHYALNELGEVFLKPISAYL